MRRPSPGEPAGLACAFCGQPVERSAGEQLLAERLGGLADFMDLCPACKGRFTTTTLRRAPVKLVPMPPQPRRRR